MQAVATIGLDIAKSIFQVHGVDSGGQVIIRGVEASLFSRVLCEIGSVLGWDRGPSHRRGSFVPRVSGFQLGGGHGCLACSDLIFS